MVNYDYIVLSSLFYTYVICVPVPFSLYVSHGILLLFPKIFFRVRWTRKWHSFCQSDIRRIAVSKKSDISQKLKSSQYTEILQEYIRFAMFFGIIQYQYMQTFIVKLLFNETHKVWYRTHTVETSRVVSLIIINILFANKDHPIKSCNRKFV